MAADPSGRYSFGYLFPVCPLCYNLVGCYHETVGGYATFLWKGGGAYEYIGSVDAAFSSVRGLDLYRHKKMTAPCPDKTLAVIR